MYWKLFTSFAKVGAFTIGGGYAMIPIIESEVVKKNKWITEEEFLDIIAVAQSAPGLIAVNVSIFIGHKLHGVKGSIVATLGSILPSFIIILLIAAIFTEFKDIPAVQAVFKGIRPVVVSLIAVPVVNMARKNKLNLLTGGIALAAMLLIAFLHISPIWILLTVAAAALIVTYIKEKKEVKK